MLQEGKLCREDNCYRLDVPLFFFTVQACSLHSLSAVTLSIRGIFPLILLSPFICLGEQQRNAACGISVPVEAFIYLGELILNALTDYYLGINGLLYTL